VYDTLLFLHLLAAFLLGVTVVMYSAVALGAATTGRALFVADRCWDVGGLGTIILGVWLVLNLDQYDITDGWIIGAIVLWLIANGLGPTVQRRLVTGETGALATTGAVSTLHWLRTLVVLGILVLMVWKPGA
jgi:cell division protein FtsW (lipid II flippase)